MATISSEANFIGFCGAGGTGKTTTAHALLKRLPTHKFLPSASRSVFQKYKVEKEDDQDLMLPSLRWAMQRDIQIAHRVEQENHRNERMVSDRTQLDQYCYAMIQCSQDLNVEDIEWLNDLLTGSLRLYRHIFYFPLHTFGEAEQNDGMRTQRIGQRTHFDILLRGLFQVYRGHIDPITVPVTSLEERVRFILMHVAKGYTL